MAMVTGVQASTGNTTYVEKKNDALGRDAFVKMFLAQLQNQDPLNPTDAKDMSAQLAQFSSLEQLFNVNQNLESLMTIQDQNNRLDVLNMIGKEITAKGDQLILTEGKAAKGIFALNEKADCQVTIRDQDGMIVKQIKVGWMEAGEHSFTWEGHNAAGNLLPPGSYRYEIKAFNAKGEELSVPTALTGRVTKVQYVDGSPILFVGKTAVTMDQLISVQPSGS